MASLNIISTPNITTQWNGSEYDHTESITVASGTTHLVVRMVGSTEEPTTLEYNSVTVAKSIYESDTSSMGAGIYVLASPTSGTKNLVLNTGGSQRTYQLIITELSGTVSIGTPSGAGGYLGNRSVAMTTVSGDIVLDVIASPTSATAGAGQATDLAYTNNAAASSETATTTSTTMSWTHVADFSALSALVFVAGSSGPSISPQDPIADGETAITHGAADFVSDPDEGTLDGYDLPAVTATTFDNIDSLTVTDGTKVPAIGTVELVIANTTENASIDLVNNLATGYLEQVMAVVDTATPDYMYDLLQPFGHTVSTGDRFRFDGSTGDTMTDAGGYSFTLPKLFTYIDSTDAAYQYRLTEAGISGGASLPVTNAVTQADNISAGLPYDGGLLAVDSVTAISHINNGLPFAENQRLCVSLGTAVAYVAGGIPFTAAGRMALSTGAVNHHANGLPFTSGGQIAVSLS
jgi:hypothetical protein